MLNIKKSNLLKFFIFIYFIFYFLLGFIFFIYYSFIYFLCRVFKLKDFYNEDNFKKNFYEHKDFYSLITFFKKKNLKITHCYKLRFISEIEFFYFDGYIKDVYLFLIRRLFKLNDRIDKYLVVMYLKDINKIFLFMIFRIGEKFVYLNNNVVSADNIDVLIKKISLINKSKNTLYCILFKREF